MGRYFAVGAAGAAIGAVLGISASYARWHDPWRERYIAQRIATVETASLSAPKGGTVVLGDSTVERVFVGDLCGGAFNAGISWGTTDRVAGVAAVILPRLRPRTIVVAVGVNDLKGGASVPAFHADYARFVSSLKAPRLVFVGTPSFPDGSRAVQEIAKTRGAAYVPPVEGPLTVDRVHQNAIGLKEWRRRVSAACQTTVMPKVAK